MACGKHTPHVSLLKYPDVVVTVAHVGTFTGYVKFQAPTGFECAQGCGWKDPLMSEMFFAPQEGVFLPEVGTTYDWEKRRYV